jgi:hypothetical protein
MFENTLSAKLDKHMLMTLQSVAQAILKLELKTFNDIILMWDCSTFHCFMCFCCVKPSAEQCKSLEYGICVRNK